MSGGEAIVTARALQEDLITVLVTHQNRIDQHGVTGPSPEGSPSPFKGVGPIWPTLRVSLVGRLVSYGHVESNISWARFEDSQPYEDSLSLLREKNQHGRYRK
ncbi:hypothetical protein ACJJTC_012882 [Scirpophaga incertulas]